MSQTSTIMDGIRRGEKEIVGHWLDILIPLAALVIAFLVPSWRPWLVHTLAGAGLWLALRCGFESGTRKAGLANALTVDARDWIVASLIAVVAGIFVFGFGVWLALATAVGAVGAVLAVRRLR